ncbi:lipid-A-disaccharide synthase [Pseudidiomarina salinarum]|uniref:Lipid-A-disaccharide synthase n=1 Tax=Pseudidiomarina salinarum TaxID=435908 RepID=A0A094IX58_9GAMM|nr:lipid-A-disaccharide synthase [Pseudidiomarina salinarum]KFZ31717.1 lipid-A-disaccharide synthase [Pseudidiomarina salinarum]RUO70512.1 lipid-A-disaccharide synthase [Pseudidiomarina salinarum]
MTEPSSAAPVIAVIAGEHSGDLLGAGMLRELRSRHPDAEFIGVGGPLMQAEGLTSIVPMDDLAVMGIAEVLGRLFTLLSHRRKLVKEFKAVRPAVFVGIDAPDFNLPIARMLKAVGIPTVHYVSPSVWAWRQGRIKGIKAAVDHVLCLLPFEKAFYDAHNLPATFVGHPLADAIPANWSKSEARAELSLDANSTVVAILPGSRAGELARLGPIFLQAAALLAEGKPQLQFIAPMISTQRAAQFRELQEQYAPELSIQLLEGQSRTAMAAADALLLTSGTVTLEAMLIKRPMVVAYKFNWLTHKLIQRLFKAAFFSLPNLLAGRELVPELVQQQVTPERLAAAVKEQLSQPAGPLIEAFTALHHQLQQDADQVSARVVAEVGNLTSYSHTSIK